MSVEAELRALRRRLSDPKRYRDDLHVDQQRAFELCLQLGLLAEAHRLNTALLSAVGFETRLARNHLALLYRLGLARKAEEFERELGGKTDLEVRRISLAARKGKMTYSEYVAELLSFLNDFGDDIDGWIELGNVYSARHHFEKAIYCFEEALLLDPNNPKLYQTLGELHFSAGGDEHISLAAKHFAFVLNLDPNYFRALKCLELCGRALGAAASEPVARACAAAKRALAARV